MLQLKQNDTSFVLFFDSSTWFLFDRVLNFRMFFFQRAFNALCNPILCSSSFSVSFNQFLFSFQISVFVFDSTFLQCDSFDKFQFRRYVIDILTIKLWLTRSNKQTNFFRYIWFVWYKDPRAILIGFFVIIYMAVIVACVLLIIGLKQVSDIYSKLLFHFSFNIQTKKKTEFTWETKKSIKCDICGAH